MQGSQSSALWESPPVDRESEPQVWVDGDGADPLVMYTERSVGSGSGGAVFEGWYQGEKVAVKRMNELDRQAIKELDVYKNSRAYRHSNLVYYKTVKIEHGLVYLVMDLCHCSLAASCPKANAFLKLVQANRDMQVKSRIFTELNLSNNLPWRPCICRRSVNSQRICCLVWRLYTPSVLCTVM